MKLAALNYEVIPSFDKLHNAHTLSTCARGPAGVLTAAFARGSFLCFHLFSAAIPLLSSLYDLCSVLTHTYSVQ